MGEQASVSPKHQQQMERAEDDHALDYFDQAGG
jgi:hypothetical protein